VTQKRVTLIVSDLHVGDGGAGDDFVDHKCQFATFVREQAATERGRAGEIELIFNGDFLEFAQTCPQAYTLDSSEYWCSEEESVIKLDCILAGHSKVFDALKAFQQPGNQVTLFEGNHDVDLHWDCIQSRIRAKAGGVRFELGNAWNVRYDGRLYISHGHLFSSVDPVNEFKNYRDPRLNQPAMDLPKRLEMCPGTLFMVQFVNHLEARYPFADNLHPPTALADILWREDRWGLKAVGWLLARFMARHRSVTLGHEGLPNIGPQLLNAIQLDDFLQRKIAAVYRDVLHQLDVTAEKVPAKLDSEDAIVGFVEELIAADVPWEHWLPALDLAKPAVSGISGSGGATLMIRQAAKIDQRQACITIAEGAWKAGAEVVVLGHTHLPQKVEKGAARYYNPGSWTRYVEFNRMDSLTLDDLRREDRFPYQLNCVRVEAMNNESLRSEMICLEMLSPS